MIMFVNFETFKRITIIDNLGLIFVKVTKKDTGGGAYELYTQSHKFIVKTIKFCETPEQCIDLEETYLKGAKVVYVEDVFEKDKFVKKDINDKSPTTKVSTFSDQIASNVADEVTKNIQRLIEQEVRKNNAN